MTAAIASCVLAAGACAPTVAPPQPPAPPPAATTAPAPPGVDGPVSPPAPFPLPGGLEYELERDSLAQWMPKLSMPRADSLGRLDWSPRVWRSGYAGRLRRAIATTGDSVAAWRAEAGDTLSPLRAFAHRWLARHALAAGDTAAADRSLDTLATLDGPWGWEALRTRCDLALAASSPVRAESLLASAAEDGRADWSDLDRAAWTVRRATMAASRGDTLRAAALALQALERWPAMAPAASATSLLERFAVARGAPKASAFARLAAESARLRGERAEAVSRYQQLLARARGDERAAIALDLARTLRESRRWAAGLALTTGASREVADAGLRARLRLEHARMLRESGQRVESIRAYAALETLAAPADVADAAAWERGIELVTAGRGEEARAAFVHAAQRGGAHADDARLMRGLLWLADGEPARAREELRGAHGEGAAFWKAILRRNAVEDSSARAGVELTLKEIAERPGYGFYQVAARETLGVRGYVAGVPFTSRLSTQRDRGLDAVDALLALGQVDDAMLVLQRWTNRPAFTTPLADSAGSIVWGVGQWTRAASLAAAAGRLPTAIRLVQRALDAIPHAGPGAWDIVSRLYPPAHDSLYRSLPDPAAADPIDRDLLRAVAWQESRFDPRARSKSDALGLYQLKLDTAGDMARRLGDPPPAREALFDPSTSLRYGREYLHWLLERLDAPWIVAVSAYNSGPSPVGDRWRVLRVRGGDALFCELIGRAETRDYVRKILGARQAYRELRPYATPPATEVPR